MKFILAENDNTTTQENDPSCSIYIENGQYCRADEEGNLIPLPKSIQSVLKFKHHAQKRKEQMEANGIDKEKAKQANKDRLKKAGENTPQTDKELQNEAARWKKSKLYQAQSEKEAELRFREKRAKESMKKYKDAKSLAVELGAEIKDFMKNQLAKKPQLVQKKSYDEPDPYEKVDPTIFTQGDVYDYETPKKDPKNTRRPLVLFYFDRSCTFNQVDVKLEYEKAEKNYGPNDSYTLQLKQMYEQINAKVQLGNDIIAMFDSFKKDVDMKPLYFSHYVYETEAEALARGGNNGTNLMNDIAMRTKGKLANVVILTDADNGTVLPTVDIEGSVWLVFADKYDGGGLVSHFNMIGKKSKIREFFYKNEE